MDNRSDRDLLICLEVKLKELQKAFENHLVHHFRYTLLAWSLALGAIITMAIALVKVL